MYLIFFFLDIIDYEQTTRLEIEGCRVERDAPWGTPARSSTTLKTDFAVFRRLPLIEPYVQFSRIRLSVWDP